MIIKIKCPHCGKDHEINPAYLLGRSKKTMTMEAIEQRRKAGKNAVEARRRKREE